jgi:hypothetical protein
MDNKTILEYIKTFIDLSMTDAQDDVLLAEINVAVNELRDLGAPIARVVSDTKIDTLPPLEMDRILNYIRNDVTYNYDNASLTHSARTFLEKRIAYESSYLRIAFGGEVDESNED